MKEKHTNKNQISEVFVCNGMCERCSTSPTAPCALLNVATTLALDCVKRSGNVLMNVPTMGYSSCECLCAGSNLHDLSRSKMAWCRARLDKSA